jgi:pimeloyl-ACP methyl ester carboxylesterase
VSSWILLRGLTRDSRHWGDFPSTLAAAIPDADIVTIDLPGCGSLNRTNSPSRIEAIAAHCRDQAWARGQRPPFNLLAMSLGGMVAIAWADFHPNEVAACVLINTSLYPFSPFHHRLRPGTYPALLRLLLPLSEQSWETAILRLTSNRAEELQHVLDSWARYRKQRPVSSGNALRQLFAAIRYRAPARRPAARLLVLASGLDMLVNPECSRRLAKAWQADYAEHPAAGHDLPLDDGAWVATQISRWCAQGSGADRATILLPTNRQPG